MDDRPRRSRVEARTTWMATPVVQRYHRPRLLLRASWAPILILLATALFGTVGAAAVAPPAPPAPPAPAPTAATATAVFGTEALVVPTTASQTADDGPLETEALLADDRVPVFFDGRWTIVAKEDQEELRKRSPQNQDEDAGAQVVTTTFQIAGSTVTMASTTATIAASPLPSPLDTNIATNFSGLGDDNPSCPRFLNAMLTNPTFKQCYPLSLLLQGSTSFFQAEKSLVSITQVLDATCAADASFCKEFLTSMAANLTSADNCGPDYGLGNEIVVKVHVALVSYQTVYSVSCLRDPDTSSYCFADAVTNLTSPANAYFYYLPLNMTLPSSAVPACSWCLQQTMAVYHASTTDRKQPVAYTYPAAAQTVNNVCGLGFVNESLPPAMLTASPAPPTAGGTPSWLRLALSAVLASALVLFAL